MGLRHGYRPENCTNGLDQLHERLLLKESYTTIYDLLGTGKLREYDSLKIVRFKFQMIFMGLPLKQPSGVEVRPRHDKKLKLAAKIRLTKCFFDDLINMAYQCVYEFSYKKLMFNVVCKNGE